MYSGKLAPVIASLDQPIVMPRHEPITGEEDICILIRPLHDEEGGGWQADIKLGGAVVRARVAPSSNLIDILRMVADDFPRVVPKSLHPEGA